jgi:hypothetical protein
MLLENKVPVVYGAGGADAVLGSGLLAVLRFQGAVIMGKTTTPAYCQDLHTDNSLFGPNFFVKSASANASDIQARGECSPTASLPALHLWQLVLQLSDELVDVGHHLGGQTSAAAAGGQAEDLPLVNRAEEAECFQEFAGRRVDLGIVLEEGRVDLEGLG